MRKRLIVLSSVLLLAVPLSASQFRKLTMDDLSRGSFAVVRGTVGPVTSAWDASGEVIYSYATLQVDQYLAGYGPRTIPIREVGGTVDGYSQQAIGFPALRSGESVVLFLSQWEDSPDARIEGFSQGKFLLRRTINGEYRVVNDPFEQGEALPSPHFRQNAVSTDEGWSLSEFERMVDNAFRAVERPVRRNQ